MALLSAFQVRKAELLKPLKWFARHFTDRGKSRDKDLKPEILIRKTRIVRVHRESSRWEELIDEIPISKREKIRLSLKQLYDNLVSDLCNKILKKKGEEGKELICTPDTCYNFSKFLPPDKLFNEDIVSSRSILAISIGNRYINSVKRDYRVD